MITGTSITGCALLFAASVAYAQDTPPSAWARAVDINGANSSGTVSWLGAWSPLRPITDISRGLTRAPLSPGLLDAPPPIAGAFTLAGSPAALARDLRPRLRGDSISFGELTVRASGESGDFRRPLDVTDSHVSGVSGIGWSPVGARGFVMGRFIVDHESNSESSFAERVAPYASTPFVTTDSVRPPMQRSRARLEGALGLRLGEFGVGVSAGIDTREHNSVDFPLRRTGRAATPGVMLGIERALPWFGLRVTGFYRWAEPNETNLLNSNPLSTFVYYVRGLDEPVGGRVDPTIPVFIRVDKRATALGGSVDFTAFETHVVATYESGDRAEDSWNVTSQAVHPIDTWRATGHEARVMLQREFGPRVRATIVGARESLTGQASRLDLNGIAVVGDDARSAIEADVRVTLTPLWSVAVTGGATRFESHRTDYVALIGTAVDAPIPFASGEVARRFGTAALAIGASTARTSPSGAVPAAARDPVYQRMLAPAIAYEVAEARASAVWLSGSVPVRGAVAFVRVRAERTSPLSIVSKRLQPSGIRELWSVSFGIRP